MLARRVGQEHFRKRWGATLARFRQRVMAQSQNPAVGSIRALVRAAYSPDFNPIERLWLRMKADFFTDWIARTSADLEDRLCTALNYFMAHPH